MCDRGDAYTGALRSEPDARERQEGTSLPPSTTWSSIPDNTSRKKMPRVPPPQNAPPSATEVLGTLSSKQSHSWQNRSQCEDCLWVSERTLDQIARSLYHRNTQDVFKPSPVYKQTKSPRPKMTPSKSSSSRLPLSLLRQDVIYTLGWS